MNMQSRFRNGSLQPVKVITSYDAAGPTQWTIHFQPLYYTVRACCTNVIQLWTRVKSEFEPGSAVNCVARKRFKRWSRFNSEPPSDRRSNFDLGSGDECWYTIAEKLGSTLDLGSAEPAEPRSWTTLVFLLNNGKQIVFRATVVNHHAGAAQKKRQTQQWCIIEIKPKVYYFNFVALQLCWMPSHSKSCTHLEMLWICCQLSFFINLHRTICVLGTSIWYVV